MNKNPLIGICIFVTCTIMFSSLTPCGSIRTNASAKPSTDINKQSFYKNVFDNGITWTDAQDNYWGANGFDHFDYPNKAIVKNANTYSGITPSNTVFAYVAAVYSNTLTILNATKSWAQTEFSSYSVPTPHDVQLLDYQAYGRVAFLCSYETGGLYAINVTNPTSMTTLDSRDDSYHAGMVFV